MSHQARFFIEITGSTLDIKLFDPGTGLSAANGQLDSNTAAVAMTTRYQLLDPSGAIYNPGGGVAEGGPLVQGFDTTAGVITENRLVRLSCNSGAAPSLTAANAGTPFGGGAGSCATALSPGLYILEVTVTSTTCSTNAYGLSVTDSTGNPYNVYTTGTADDTFATVAATDSTLEYGRGNTGGGIANAIVSYPYVNRGCSATAMNFDSDSSGTMALVDVLGATTPLTVSANDATATTVVTVENVAGVNYAINNYGVFTQTQTLAGAGTNFVDIRYADWQSAAAGSPANLPFHPVDPLRTYLPNGYSACGAASCTMVAPTEPVLLQAAVISSGNNPPVVGVGQSTTYLLTVTLHNPTSNPITNPVVTLPYDPTPSVGGSASFVSGSDSCSLNGVGALCTFGAGSAGGYDFRTATFVGTIPAGSALSFQYEVTVADITSAGAFDLTAPPSAVDPVTEATYTPAFNSGAFPQTENLGALCQLRADTTATVLTRARVQGVEVTDDRVSFAVLSQRRTKGYSLFGRVGPERRFLGSVGAPYPDSVSPLVYSVAASALSYSSIEIEETELNGTVSALGPFATGDRRLAWLVERTRSALKRSGATVVSSDDGEALVLPPSFVRNFASDREGRVRRETLRRQKAGRSRRSGDGEGLKIMTEGDGAVAVALSDLVSAGLPPSVRAEAFRVWNLGRRVRHTVFTDASGSQTLRFTATALDTRYTRQNAYVVTWRSDPPPSASRLTFDGGQPSPGFERVERNRVYIPNAPVESSPWVWDVLGANAGSWPYATDPSAGTFDLNKDASDALTPVVVSLAGWTDHQHTVTAHLNGFTVGSISFSGRKMAEIRGLVPRESLFRANNKLTLDVASGGLNSETAAVLLDAIDVGVGTEDRARVVGIERFDTHVPTARARYAIVTHEDFAAAAATVAAAKEAEGLSTSIVDVERVYDRYSGGVRDASAIRDYLRTRSGLRYALLVGDDTIDYKNDLGLSTFPVIPSMYVDDGQFGRIPSDNGFADLTGDGIPEISLGRLPVQTIAEANAMAAKIARSREILASVPVRHLVVTDNKDGGSADFRASADRLALSLPADTPVAFADVSTGVDSARQTMSQALALGARFTTYIGHGGPETWADEGVLTVDDVPSLTGYPETIALMWACETQYSTYLFGPTISEALLLLPRGGALATIGPSGITDSADQEALFKRLYPLLDEPGITLGDALRRAKRATAAEPGLESVIAGFNLLGDPALKLRP